MSFQLTSEGERVTLSISTQAKSEAGDVIELNATTVQASPGSDITTTTRLSMAQTLLVEWNEVVSLAKESAQLDARFGDVVTGIQQVAFTFDLTKPDTAVGEGTIDGKSIQRFTVTSDGEGGWKGPESIQFLDGTQPEGRLDEQVVSALKALHSTLQAEHEEFSRQAQPIPQRSTWCWTCLGLCSVAIWGCVAACPASGPAMIACWTGCWAAGTICTRSCPCR